jgi:predicted nucleic acid-binding protein
MPSKPLRFYWDANVFLSYINLREDRLAPIDEYLAQARRGDVQIITSVITVAEVAFATTEQDARALDPDVQARIERLWALGSPVQLVDLHMLIAERARDMQRAGVSAGWTGLRSVDAMHLATAAHEHVDEFHTYDERKLDRYAPVIGCRVGHPAPPQMVMIAVGDIAPGRLTSLGDPPSAPQLPSGQSPDVPPE